MIALGITDRMNFYLGTPYVTAASTEPNGGHLAGVNGFQDLGLALKYQWVKHESNKGALTAFTTLGFSTPMTNYLSDYMPYSLGFGAPELSLRGIAQYKFNMGLYFRGGLAWMWRGYTEAERDYYYNNGSQYSAWMDVPNAWNIDGAAGIWLLNNTLKLEINYSGVKSTSGDDIRAYNAAQPTNKVMFDRVGASAQYYLPGRTGLGFVVYHSEVLEGRNAAKTNNTGAGLTWQFNVLKKKNKQ